MRAFFAFFFPLPLLAGPEGCLDDRCGPGQVLDGYNCATTAAAQDASDTQDTQGDGTASLLGAPCHTYVGDCQGTYSACVIFPGQTTGYCSLPNCLQAPDDCPSGYRCIDVSAYTNLAKTACIRS